MRISWNILRHLVQTADLSPQQAADVLTGTGLEVEQVDAVESVPGMLRGVVVGHVLTCAPHPDADRLRVCTVDVGADAALHIVCGAPNVAAGQKVLVATIGTELGTADGGSFTIKKSKIRGAESHGMICAADELGLPGGHEGIMVLPAEAVVGTPAAEQLALYTDSVLEVGLTPNRSDALGHLGVARDLHAACTARGTAATRLLPIAAEPSPVQGAARTVQVQVDAPDAAPRYAGIVLSDVRVGPSPAWLRDALLSLGLKPINNVVDITNYVQHELGQPLHAFDADTLRDGRIIVRRARTDEPFTTLDGKELKLTAEDLVIADGQGPACLAGIYGGKVSGVSDTTTSIFLESACFDAATVRRSARRHGLHTDASFRFERGVDPATVLRTLWRAVHLLQQEAGARVASTVTDLDAGTWKPVELRLRYSALQRLSGLRIEKAEVEQVLSLLDFTISGSGEDHWDLSVPTYRVDVLREADVVEEVLRIVGFDRVPVLDRLAVPSVPRAALSAEGLRVRMAEHFAARGFREIMTPSLVSAERSLRFGGVAEEQLVRLRNPLSAELNVLRPSLVFGAVAAVAYNSARQQRDLRLFEQGRTYRVEKGAVQEQALTVLALTGARNQESWRAADEGSSEADLRAELELLLQRLGLPRVQVVPGEHPVLGASTLFTLGGHTLCAVAAVPSALLGAMEVDRPLWVAEIYDDALTAALAKKDLRYVEVPRTPAVRRDLSLLLDTAVAYADLERIAFGAERQLLKAVRLFDVYEGNKLPAGKKSYALSFTLQHKEQTLTDVQVDKAMGRIRQALEKEVGAELRG